MGKSGTFGMTLHQALSFSPLFLRIPKAEAVFWPGCALMQLDPAILQKTLAVLCREEPGTAMACGCCGQPTRYLFPGAAPRREEKLIARLKKQGIRRIYTACPNCTRTLEGLGDWEIIPIWHPLARNLRQEDLSCPAGAYVLHDPCPMRNDPEALAAVRVLLDLAKCDYVQPEQSREKTRCCGSAGMLRAKDPEKSALLRRRRLAQLDSTRTILSCCEGCLDAFRTEGRDTCHLLEFLFGRSKKRTWANRVRNSQP